MNTMGDMASRRKDHFKLIRMLAATAVLISHSYPLSQGSSAVEPMAGWLGISLGELAVITFFCVSGFFIALSRDRAPGTIDFFTARFLRIYPGLTLALLVSVFLIGPIFTTLETHEYFRSGATYSYLSNNLTLFKMQFQLPGLFEDNPWPGINGSLWTLFYEVTLYVVVGGLGVFGCLGNGRRFAGFLLIYAVAYVVFKVVSIQTTWLGDMHRVQYFFKWVMPFALGVSLYRYRHHIQHRFIWFLPLAALAAWSYQTRWYFECFVLAWAYLIFYLGFSHHALIERYNRLGDYSYGVYLYGFPVQEILAHQFKGIGPVSMILAAFPIALVAAIASWHIIEKPATTKRHVWAAQISHSFSGLKAYWTSAGKGTA